MNRNKRDKNKKQNEAISNMGNSTSFQSLHNEGNNSSSKSLKNENHGEEDFKYFFKETY